MAMNENLEEVKADIQQTDESSKVNIAENNEVEKGEESITAKVAERLHFFFSDANLRIDKFLRREILNQESEGFIPIETLLRFNTIKKFTTNPVDLVKAVKCDKCCSILKLNEDETSIARKVPFTPDMMKDNVKLTLRVSDIPVDSTGEYAVYKITREDLSNLFQEFGNVALVRLLHMNSKNGKRCQIALGKAFVEFESVTSLENAVKELCVPLSGDEEADKNLKPKRILEMNGNKLRVKTMQQWLDEKSKKFGTKHGSNETNTYHFEKKHPREEETENEVKIEESTFTIDWKPGCVISMKGLPESCDREMIISSITEFIGDTSKVRADYSRGLKDGKIRFEEPNDKIKDLASKLNDGSITIGDTKIDSASILEGDEEKLYYKQFIAFRQKQQNIRKDERARKKFRYQRGRGRR
mmetsp:Transcript_14153/g.20216  ORF Transcript_14153/g.20216 Transcript_14153/m.20216 type:complete len:414 (+) Transcript_14153:140-1381(+)